MSQIWATKESWSTDMSPTALFFLAALPYPWFRVVRQCGYGAGVSPGWGMAGGWVGGLYRVLPSTLIQDPYLVIFSLRALPTAV